MLIPGKILKARYFSVFQLIEKDPVHVEFMIAVLAPPPVAIDYIIVVGFQD